MIKSLFKIYLFLSVLIISFPIEAKGLGKLSVNSYLGQPLKAEIDLVGVNDKEISSLKVGLAPDTIFELANVNYRPILDSFEFSIKNRTNGQPYIKIVSSHEVIDTSLIMLVQLDWPGGNIIREYTVYLQSPDKQFQTVLPEVKSDSKMLEIDLSEQNVSKEQNVTDNLINDEKNEVFESTSEHLELDKKESEFSEYQSSHKLEENMMQEELSIREPENQVSTYGPIKEGDTLFSITQEISYKVQTNQMLIALHRANPEAFSEKNINLLKAGAILQIPEEKEVSSISPDEADLEVKMQTESWEAYRQKIAKDASYKTPINKGPDHTIKGKISTIIEEDDIKIDQESQDGILKLSRGITDEMGEDIEKKDESSTISIQEKFNIVEDNSIASEKAINEASQRISLLEQALEENQIANELALYESNQRIIELEKTIQKLKDLLELKNQTMANSEKQANIQVNEEHATVLKSADKNNIKISQIDSQSKIKSKQTGSKQTESKQTESKLLATRILWIIIFLVFAALLWNIRQIKRQKENSDKSKIF